MTINLSLILQKTRIQKQFPISIFLAFIDSLVVSALQDAGSLRCSRPTHSSNTEGLERLRRRLDAGGYAIYRQNNLELHLGCHTC